MKRIASLLLCLLLLSLLAAPAFSAGMEDAELQNVINNARIFTDEERDALNRKAETISHKYRCAVYLIAVPNYRSYGNDLFEAARGLYQDYSLGYGEGHDGILLLLSMANRDYELITFGYGGEAFTDYGQTAIIKAFTDDFAEDHWYAGAEDYLDMCARLLSMARSGNVFSAKNDPEALYAGIFFSAILGLIAAFIVRGSLKRKMRSVARGKEANRYIPAEGAVITHSSDVYSHTTETRHKIESSSSGSSRHSGGGFTGRSGKF